MSERKHWTEFLTEDEKAELTRAELYVVELRTKLHEACIERRQRDKYLSARKKAVELKILELQNKLKEMEDNNGEA